MFGVQGKDIEVFIYFKYKALNKLTFINTMQSRRYLFHYYKRN